MTVFLWRPLPVSALTFGVDDANTLIRCLDAVLTDGRKADVLSVSATKPAEKIDAPASKVAAGPVFEATTKPTVESVIQQVDDYVAQQSGEPEAKSEIVIETVETAVASTSCETSAVCETGDGDIHLSGHSRCVSGSTTSGAERHDGKSPISDHFGHCLTPVLDSIFIRSSSASDVDADCDACEKAGADASVTVGETVQETCAIIEQSTASAEGVDGSAVVSSSDATKQPDSVVKVDSRRPPISSCTSCELLNCL
jgi:hypothetical protein